VTHTQKANQPCSQPIGFSRNRYRWTGGRHPHFSVPQWAETAQKREGFGIPCPPFFLSTQKNPVIRTFYQRLCQAGKAKKLALTACMRKLLTILNAMVKNGTLLRHDATPVEAEAEGVVSPEDDRRSWATCVHRMFMDESTNRLFNS